MAGLATYANGDACFRMSERTVRTSVDDAQFERFANLATDTNTLSLSKVSIAQLANIKVSLG